MPIELKDALFQVMTITTGEPLLRNHAATCT